jgi:hypothetical protein
MIKIEVTGNSIPEVADKLLAIGHSLYSKTVVPIANGGTGAQTLEELTGAKTLEELFTEVAEAAPVDPTPARKSAPVAEVSESRPTTAEPSSTPAPAASASEDEELEVVDLPIAVPEVNLRDLVLSVVEKRGKPVMEEILSRFGAAKASLVDPALRPELIDLCNEALSK